MPVICEPLDIDISRQQVFGDSVNDGHVIIKTNTNAQLLYLDGACSGDAPLYLGITKSRGTQENKLPVEAGDMLGGLQVYARTVPGTSSGYCHQETPLSAAIQFKVDETYKKNDLAVPTELLIALSNNDGMAVKVVIDSAGNINTVGNIQTGNLCITDIPVSVTNLTPERFVQVIYNNKKYAMPMYLIQETTS